MAVVADTVKLAALELGLRRLFKVESDAAIALQADDLHVKAENRTVTAPEQAIRLVNDAIDTYVAVARGIMGRFGGCDTSETGSISYP